MLKPSDPLYDFVVINILIWGGALAGFGFGHL